METIGILAAVFAVVATVLTFIFIVPEKRRAKLNRFGKFLHDTVNFKFLIVEKILQALYILATAYVFVTGFFLLFYVREGYSSYYYSIPSTWYGGYGLLLMIVGPIAVRVGYEFLMMFVLLVKNVIKINNKIKGENAENDPDAVKDFKVEKKEEKVTYCPNCGTENEGGSFCALCGIKLR